MFQLKLYMIMLVLKMMNYHSNKVRIIFNSNLLPKCFICHNCYKRRESSKHNLVHSNCKFCMDSNDPLECLTSFAMVLFRKGKLDLLLA